MHGKKDCLGEVKTYYLLGLVCALDVLGGYDMEEKAARAYDLAALKYWGPSTHINFPVTLFTRPFLP